MATPDTKYVVSVKLTADDKEVRDAIAHLTSMAEGQAANSAKKAVSSVTLITDSFKQIGQAMSGFRHQIRALTQTYQTVRNVVGFGFRDALSGAIGINQDLENIEMGMSAVLTSVDRIGGGPFAKLTDAQKEVTRLMGVMREEARQTPAEFDGIAQAFSVMLPSTRALVNNLDDVAKLAANASTWDKLAQVGTGTTARDFKQILTGHMSMREIQNPMLAKKLLDLKEIFNEARKLEESGDMVGNRTKMREMLLLMTKLTELDTDVKSMMENSFTGQKEALVNQLKLLVQEGMKPLWDELKETLKKLNAWANSPQGAAKIKEFAKDAGEFLKDAAIVLKGVFEFFYNNWKIIAPAFLTFMGIWAGKNVLALAGGLAQLAVALRSSSLKDLGMALLGFKAKEGVAGVAGAAGAATSSVAAVGWKGNWASNLVMGATGAATLFFGLIPALEAFSNKLKKVAEEETDSLKRLAVGLGMNPHEIPRSKPGGLAVPGFAAEVMEKSQAGRDFLSSRTNYFFEKKWKELNEEAERRAPASGFVTGERATEIMIRIATENDIKAKATVVKEGKGLDVKVGTSNVGTGGTP